jgi:hypothetical protein
MKEKENSDMKQILIEKELMKKIDREYSRFYMMMEMTSKANLFANSDEIEKKKRITKYLKDMVGKLDETIQGRMLTSDNLMEEFYCSARDVEFDALGQTLDRYLEMTYRGEEADTE